MAAIYRKVQRDMRNGEFVPEVVLGIEGGGVFVGGMLVTNFLRPALLTRELPVKFCVLNRVNRMRDGESTTEFSDCERTRIANIVRGKHVLLVDATFFAGKTMSASKAFGENRGAAKIRTATVYQRAKGTGMVAHYFVKKVMREKEFSWEISEAYKQVYGRGV